MPSVPLLEAESHWLCPNCDVTAVKPNRPIGPGESRAEFHRCAGLGGLDAPMVLEGVRAKVEAIDREDYLGGDIPTRDDEGRVKRAIVTTRDDGQDCAVLAPCIGNVRFA